MLPTIYKVIVYKLTHLESYFKSDVTKTLLTGLLSPFN